MSIFAYILFSILAIRYSRSKAAAFTTIEARFNYKSLFNIYYVLHKKHNATSKLVTSAEKTLIELYLKNIH